MVQAQTQLNQVPRSGAYSYLLEHVGDLTHRMAQRNTEKMGYGAEWVAPKVNGALRTLKSIADIDDMNAIPELPVFNDYAQAHASLPVYNDPQKWARDAAVAIGKRDFVSAQKNLTELKNILDDGSYEEKASAYRPK